MLDTLRKGANGWIAKVFMGLLVMSFAVWGIADSFNPSSSDTVAKVGKAEISVSDLEFEIDNDIQSYSRRLGQQITKREAAQYGIPASALSRLIALAALDQGAYNMDMAIGDEAVTNDIVADPALQGASGKFNAQSFRMALRQAGMDEKMFIVDRRGTMLRKQLADGLTAGVSAPDFMTRTIWAYQTETRSADYFRLPPEAAGEIADPDEKTIEAFYKKASSRFMEPEQRNFTLMVLNPSDLATSIAISDADLKAAYEQRRGEFDVPEKRTVEQIPFGSMEAAKAASERLKKGEAKEKILSEIGMKQSDIELGTITRAQMLSPELAEAAFALDKGAYSEPVQGPLAAVVLHVTSIEPGKTSTFDEVKDELRQKMAQEKAQNDIYDVQNSIEDSRAGGMALEEIADKNALTLKKFTGITAQGEGTKDLPKIQSLIPTVFGAQEGDQTPPGDSGQGGYYWIRVDAIKPSTLKPLDKVKPEAVSLWKEEMRKTELLSLARKLTDRGNKGEEIGKLAASVKAKVETTSQLTRNAEDKSFSRTANAQLFSKPEGSFSFGPATEGDDLLVMRVSEIKRTEPDVNSKEYKDLKANIDDSLQNDVFVSYVAALQKELVVEVNTPLFQRISSTDSPQQ